MADIKIKLTGFAELQKRLRGFPDKLRKSYMRNGMRALVAYLRKGARKRVPARSGALRRSIGISTRLIGTDTVRGKVFTGAAIGAGKLKGRDAWYGHIIERGAKPHIIRAKTAKGLAIPGGAGRRFGIFQSVQHPGIRGRYFIRSTAQQDMNQAQRIFKNYVESKSKDWLEGRV